MLVCRQLKPGVLTMSDGSINNMLEVCRWWRSRRERRLESRRQSTKLQSSRMGDGVVDVRCYAHPEILNHARRRKRFDRAGRATCDGYGVAGRVYDELSIEKSVADEGFGGRKIVILTIASNHDASVREIFLIVGHQVPNCDVGHEVRQFFVRQAQLVFFRMNLPRENLTVSGQCRIYLRRGNRRLRGLVAQGALKSF